MFLYLQILLITGIAISICSLIKNKTVALLTTLLLGLFIILELLSINMGGNLIDYRFYEHIDLKTVWSVKGFFSSSIIVFTLIYIIVCLIIYISSRWLNAKDISRWKYAIIILACFIGASVPEGAFYQIYEIIKLKTAKDKSFVIALNDLGIDSSTYVTSENITATAGKNIIVLSLESLERGYLEEPLQHLTPNLTNLAKSKTYLPIEENLGSHWTTASIYSSITGMPAYFKSEGNSIFQNAESSKISNIGNVLNAAGYNVTYMIGNKEFSGINDMLNTFGFTVKSENDFETQYKKINWGIHDKDLFNEAKKEILTQQNTNQQKITQQNTTQQKTTQPFALFLSTISGHYPNGVYDKSMEGVIPKQDSDLEFMTLAVDYYIGNLIEFLKEENLYDNTAIFIFPDHKLMFEKSDVINKFKNERGLYLITNEPKNQVLQKVTEPIIQLDIPRIILNGSGVKTNATFLTDYIKADKTKYIEKNKKHLLALNEASLLKNDYTKGITIEWNSDNKQIKLSSGENNFNNMISNFEENTLYIIKFQNDMRYHSFSKISHKERKNGFAINRYSENEIIDAFKSKSIPTLTISVVEDSIFGYFQKGKIFGIAKNGLSSITFEEDELAVFKNWKNTHISTDFNKNKIYLRSTGYTNENEYGKSRIFTGLKPHEITRGLNVLFIENEKYVVKNYDTYANNEDAKAFMELVQNLLDNKIEFIIVAHDSAEQKLEPYREKLDNLGLSVLSDIQKREAYVGYYIDGEIIEEKHPKSITKQVDITQLPVDPDIALRKKDVSRFIAHAGGAINGETYTNSLEALDISYSKGFRLFELDIIKTSDNYFVSAHDWKHWSQKTKYKGELPPTRQVFLDNPIGQYTPLTLDKINSWFTLHPDAILVTDKVNTPKEFASKFIDSNRLMMELFSEEALKEAKLIGIKGALASENVLKKNRGKELETLKKLGVKYIAISRRSILEEISLLKQLRDNGIKTYVYNVNFDKGRDENYVAEVEMDYIYGMYADEWDFRE